MCSVPWGEYDAVVRWFVLLATAPIVAGTWVACSKSGAGDDPTRKGDTTDAQAESDGAVVADSGGTRRFDAGVVCDSGSTEIVINASVVSDGGNGGKCGLVVGGVDHADNCYWVPDREPLTSEFVNSRCQKLDPKDHSVTIGSVEENDFLVSTFPTCEERWIGLWTTTDAGSVGPADFYWKDTTVNDFRAWAPGFPTGSGKCVIIRPDGLWENRSCIEMHTVICERE